jgi:hypothetical protein
MKFSSPHPNELLKIITGDQPEKYTSQRIVALLTFLTWMRWPLEKNMWDAAHVAAAAVVLLKQSRQGKPIDSPLTREALAEALIETGNAAPFADIFPADDPIAEIVGFFMHCPEVLKPSLIKARYFIQHGGFAPDDVTDQQELKQYIRKRSTLKSVWAQKGPAGPFLWAAHQRHVKLLNILPDTIQYGVEKADRLLKQSRVLKDFLGEARFCQEKLIRLLDLHARKRVQFLTFPPSVTPLSPKGLTFDRVQLKILRGYVSGQDR